MNKKIFLSAALVTFSTVGHASYLPQNYSIGLAAGPSLLNSKGSEEAAVNLSFVGGDKFVSTKQTDAVDTNAEVLGELAGDYHFGKNSRLGVAVDFTPSSASTDLDWLIHEQNKQGQEANKLLDNDYNMKIESSAMFNLRYTFSPEAFASNSWSFGLEAGISTQKITINQTSAWFSGKNINQIDSYNHNKRHTGVSGGAFIKRTFANNFYLMGRYVFNYIGKVNFSSTFKAGAETQTFSASQNIYTNSMLIQAGYQF